MSKRWQKICWTLYKIKFLVNNKICSLVQSTNTLWDKHQHVIRHLIVQLNGKSIAFEFKNISSENFLDLELKKLKWPLEIYLKDIQKYAKFENVSPKCEAKTTLFQSNNNFSQCPHKSHKWQPNYPTASYKVSTRQRNENRNCSRFYTIKEVLTHHNLQREINLPITKYKIWSQHWKITYIFHQCGFMSFFVLFLWLLLLFFIFLQHNVCWMFLPNKKRVLSLTIYQKSKQWSNLTNSVVIRKYSSLRY